MPSELRIENLRAGYLDRDVLCDVACALPAGQLSCILGPNGAGKTTLLRAICALAPLRSGRISLDGQDLRKLAPRARARLVALVPQLAQDSLPLTVAEAVALGRYPHLGGGLTAIRPDTAALEAALAATGMAGMAQAQCNTLSGGEWRRMLIAQGLMQDTPVLLLDEPTAFLDPPARHQTLAMLARLAAERQLIVAAVLHDIELSRAHAGHAVLLRAGRVLSEGPARETLSLSRLAELYDCQPEWLEYQGTPQ